MKFIKNICRDDGGGITIATALILVAVIILNLVLYDFAVFKMSLSRSEMQLKLACNSVLASYDALLAEKYGLYGYNLSSSYMSGKTFDYYYPCVENKVDFSENFTEPNVMKKQILDLMTLKTPANIIDTVLEAVGIFEESDSVCDAHKECGEASEILLEMQKITKELKIKIEGYYNGYVACVNGYKTQVAIDLLNSASKNNNDFVGIINGIIGVQEQYYNYNNEAAILFSKQYAIYEKLQRKISEAKKNNEASESVDEISKNARTLLNSGARKFIEKNVTILSSRISMLKKIRDSENIKLSDVKNLFNGDLVKSNVVINDVVASSSETSDVRNDIYEDIQEASGESVFSVSKYEIPRKEYVSLPSVIEEKRVEAEKSLYNLNSDGFMDTFSSFSGIFSYWDNFSFEKLAVDIKEKILIDDYILSYMTSRLDGASNDQMNNEIEYIIGGDSACETNNSTVEQRILMIRFVLNFADILSDKTKCAIAQSMAVALAAIISMGAGSTLYKYIIIASWALIDSYSDVNDLLKGESVPIIEVGESDNKLNELQDYGFYLRLLLLFMDEETKLLRISDVIQLNMREFTGEEYKLNGIYSKISVKAVSEVEFIFPVVIGSENVYRREDEYEISY